MNPCFEKHETCLQTILEYASEDQTQHVYQKLVSSNDGAISGNIATLPLFSE